MKQSTWASVIRLPVMRAFAATWAFLAERWLDVLRIVWLPLLLQTLLGRLIDPAFPGAVLLVAVIWLITSALLTAGLLKLVIRGETPSQPFYLAFGLDELKLIGTWATLGLLFIAGGFCIIVVSAALSAVPVVGELIGGLLPLLAMIWLLARLSLSGPATINEQRLGIVPSWRTTRGMAGLDVVAFWAIWCLIGFLISWLMISALLPDYFSSLSAIFAAEPDQRPALAEAFEAKMAGWLDTSRIDGIGRVLAFLVFNLVWSSLTTIAGAVAWRMLVDARPASPAEAPQTKGPWG
jgi:hypothetical protein